MPNRADHSVKKGRPERALAIKGWTVVGGIVTAVIGALAAMFTGGLAGLLLGSGVLTTIIFLQIFLMPRMSSAPVSKKIQPTLTEPDAAHRPALSQAPMLILNVTPLGRIRSVLGRQTLLPQAQIGTDIDAVLSETTSVKVARIPAMDGAWVVVMSEAADNGTEALDERTSFFAGLGHDLKSPLNAVIGFSEIMESELRGPLPEAYKDYPSLIRESGQTLLRLVEDMLAFAKSEAGTYELDLAPMDIAASGESVLRQSQAMADKADVRLHFVANTEVTAMADADAIRRIWDNLVSNAIKYSAPGETVTLTARMVGDTSVLQVSDTGAGMDADDLARIAKPFAQGRNAKGRTGTGLGLAMVQRLAEMQGGKVEIRTAPGQGTTVTVRLPAHRGDEKRAAE
ncbi:MAG: HAMP domain-containing sensor histidine kinase [Pseudomonadota bacterium]